MNTNTDEKYLTPPQITSEKKQFGTGLKLKRSKFGRLGGVIDKYENEGRKSFYGTMPVTPGFSEKIPKSRIER